MKNTRAVALAHKLAGTRKLAQQARESAADKAFDLEHVSQAITMAASGGLDTLTVNPVGPLDLRQTRTAKETTAMLKEAGFAVVWEKRQLHPDADMWVMTVDWR